nr:FH2 domain-containing protein 1 [Ciona intestinalis]|eukprot:XP_002127689.1 FH2 domain-containing protein 1 [Ciona intestinalis]
METPSLLPLDYLAVNSSSFATSSETSIDSGTESGSHRSPSDSECFDGKYDLVFPPTTSESPVMKSTSNSVPPPPSLPPPPNAPPPPPPPLGFNSKFGVNMGYNAKDNKRLRRLNWQKIPDIQINSAGETNIWMEGKSGITVDFSTIDDLFAVQEKTPLRKSPPCRSFTPDSDSSNPDEAKPGTISLLDSKRSLNVNIFLRQFKRSPTVLAESIKQCDVSFMNSDKLRALRKLLPDKEEIKVLKGFQGNIASLDTAETFFVHVINVPYYVIRIDAMLLREEFDHAMSQVEQSISVLLRAIKELRQCFALPTILHFVLQAGNYLNRGAAFGNAVGFRLASLKTLTDTKANKPGMTLMHYVAMELEKHDPGMIGWTEEIPSVGLASRISDEEVRQEISIFNNRVVSLRSKVESESDDDLREHVTEFLKDAEERLNTTRAQEHHLTEMSKELATYLCERKEKFSLNSCFQIVSEFRNKFSKCSEENKKRQQENKRKASVEKQATDRNNNANQFNNNNNNNNNNNSKKQVHSQLSSEDKSTEKQTSNFRRSNSLATPHQRYKGARSTSDLSDDVTVTSSIRRRNDNSFLRRTSLAKPEEHEIAKLYQKQFQNGDVKEAWPECQSNSQSTNQGPRSLDERLRLFGSSPNSKPEAETEVSTTFSRRRRFGSLRTRSLRGGARIDDDEELVLHLQAHQEEHKTEVDLEESMDRFVTRERSRLFERTQLRRSYVRMPRKEPSSKEEEESDSDVIADSLPAPDVRRRSWRHRRSPLASQSTSCIDQCSEVFSQPDEQKDSAAGENSGDVTKPRRHDDIRERIRRYKTAASCEEDTITDRRLSSSSILSRKESTASSCDSSLVSFSEDVPEAQPIRRRLDRRRTIGGNETQFFPDNRIETSEKIENVAEETTENLECDKDTFVKTPAESETEEPIELNSTVTVEEEVIVARESSITELETPATTISQQSSVKTDEITVTEVKTEESKEKVNLSKPKEAKARGIPQMRKTPIKKVGLTPSPSKGQKNILIRSRDASPATPSEKVIPNSGTLKKKLTVRAVRSRDSSPAPSTGNKYKPHVTTRASSLSPTRKLHTPITEVKSFLRKIKKKVDEQEKDSESIAVEIPTVIVSHADDLQNTESPSITVENTEKSVSESKIPKRPSSTNSSPTRLSRPASRSTGIVTPATQTSNTMNRAARLRQNKTQTSSQISVKPASRFSSPVKSTPKAKEVPKKPAPKPVSQKPPVKSKVNSPKTVRKPTDVKKKATNIKSPRSVTPKNAKTVPNKPIPTNVPRPKPKVPIPMKETNLSDAVDSPGQSGAPNNTTAPHSGVQMNRAARLRMLKKNSEAKSNAK